jgi:glutamyl-tRNA synthetase
MGYLPEAVVNYLARLGWSHGDDEIFTREQLVKLFDWKHVGATAGVFNPDKMQWVNHTWMRSLGPEQLARRALPFFRAAGMDAREDAKLLAVVRLYQDRAKTLADLAAQARYLYLPVALDPKAREKFLNAETLPVLRGIRDGLAGMEPDVAGLEKLFHATAEARGLGLGKVAQPVRVALTGGTASPGIYDVVALLGKAEALKRLDDAIRLVG